VSHDDAKIYDQSYRPWKGELASPRSRFLIIAANELRQAWKDKWFKRIVWFSFGPLIVFAVLTVVAARFAALGGQMPDVWIPFWDVQMFFSMLMAFFIGRGAVGEDLRSGALVVYFSRPVSFIQYLTGKWMAIAAGVLGVTLLPGLVLAVFRWLAEPDATAVDFLRWMGALLALSLLLALCMGWMVLAISALAGRARAAGIVWVILFFVSFGVAEGLSNATGIYELNATGFSQASKHLAGTLFGGDGSFARVFWFTAGQLGWALLGLAAVLFRLRRWVRV
jgi:ABC-2 type transport system permease protein